MSLLFDYAHTVEAFEDVVLLVRDTIYLSEIQLERDVLTLFYEFFVDHDHKAALLWLFFKFTTFCE